MQSIPIRIDAFEGPFDLLYHLIEKNELDIYDIPIALITEQYLAFLENAENKLMDSMSEFLLMAATLLEIKSKMLLPKPQKGEQEDGPDPRAELVVKLLEYKRFKTITKELRERQEQAAMLYFKDADSNIKALYGASEELSLSDFLQGVTMNDIYKAFEEVMQKKEMKIDRIRSSFNAVERDLYTIEEKIDYISDLLVIHRCVSFHSIFREDSRKLEIVVTFLALLELIKRKQVNVFQNSPFEEILLKNAGSEDNENN